MQDIVSWDHISNIKTPSDNRLQTLQFKLRALLMLRNLVFVISPTNWYSVWENDLLWLTGQASIYHFSRRFVCFYASTQASVLTKHCLPITATKNLHCTFKYLRSISSASCFFKIPDTYDGQYNLEVSNDVFTAEVEFKVTSVPYALLIQTDKPIYKPSQTGTVLLVIRPQVIDWSVNISVATRIAEWRIKSLV